MITTATQGCEACMREESATAPVQGLGGERTHMRVRKSRVSRLRVRIRPQQVPDGGARVQQLRVDDPATELHWLAIIVAVVTHGEPGAAKLSQHVRSERVRTRIRPGQVRARRGGAREGW